MEDYLVTNTLKASFVLKTKCFMCMGLSLCACEQVSPAPDRKKAGDGGEGKREAVGDREVY